MRRTLYENLLGATAGQETWIKDDVSIAGDVDSESGGCNSCTMRALVHISLTRLSRLSASYLASPIFRSTLMLTLTHGVCLD